MSSNGVGVAGKNFSTFTEHLELCVGGAVGGGGQKGIECVAYKVGVDKSSMC